MQPRAADHNQASAEHKNDADMHFYVLWQTPCMTPFSFQMRMHPLSIELEPCFVELWVNNICKCIAIHVHSSCICHLCREQYLPQSLELTVMNADISRFVCPQSIYVLLFRDSSITFDSSLKQYGDWRVWRSPARECCCR